MQRVDEYRVSAQEFRDAAKKLALADIDCNNAVTRLFMDDGGISCIVGRDMKPCDVAVSILKEQGVELRQQGIEPDTFGVVVVANTKDAGYGDGRHIRGPIYIRVCTDVKS